jgi:hypothetical protein
VIPVRVGREGEPRPQAAVGEIGGQSGDVGRRQRRVDDQAPAVVGDHDRAVSRTPLGRRDENARGDLAKALHSAFL